MSDDDDVIEGDVAETEAPEAEVEAEADVEAEAEVEAETEVEAAEADAAAEVGSPGTELEFAL